MLALISAAFPSFLSLVKATSGDRHRTMMTNVIPDRSHKSITVKTVRRSKRLRLIHLAVLRGETTVDANASRAGRFLASEHLVLTLVEPNSRKSTSQPKFFLNPNTLSPRTFLHPLTAHKLPV